MEECVHGNCSEYYEDKCSNDDSDNLDSVEPGLVVPTDGLEHAPETVAEVEPYCNEPDDVDQKNPYAAECLLEKHVRILSLASGEFHKLHLGPEVCKVEEDDAEDDDTEYEHVLG